jgi:hypothetical protein
MISIQRWTAECTSHRFVMTFIITNDLKHYHPYFVEL